MEKTGGEKRLERGAGWGKAGSPHLCVSSIQNSAGTTYNSVTVCQAVNKIKWKGLGQEYGKRNEHWA